MRGRAASLVLASIVLVLLVLATPSSPVAATVPLPLTHGWTRVVDGGFTDPGNTHVAFTVEFHDQLYVSTMASGQGKLYSGSEKLGGDIWRTSDGVNWEQVGTAGLGNPNNFMFDFVVFKDRLYAVSYNMSGEGIEVWATPDGTEFTKLAGGGFGDPGNDHAVPFVFADRLILVVANSKTGVQVWVSDDSETFRQVVTGGLGIPGTTGALRYIDPMEPQPVFNGMLYVGISNPTAGGEIWRTADGIEWERTADGGLGRATSVSLGPDIVFDGRLYAEGNASGTLEDLEGFELFRTSDGTTWEKVVEDGFSMGVERNVSADLVEFEGRLYLTTSNMDPRILVPSAPSERHAPYGFQLYVSDDGSTWTQVGDDGFGISTSYVAGTVVLGDTAYVEASDYHIGGSVWKSTDGEQWQIVFQDPEADPFTGGSGVLDFQCHLLWISNDLEKGLEIWRTDDVVVAGSDDTACESGATVASGDRSDNGPIGPAASEEGTKKDGLSGGWVALFVILAVIAGTGIGMTAYLLGRMRHRNPPPLLSVGEPVHTTSAQPPQSTQPTRTEQSAQSIQPTQTEQGASAPQFCAGCGAPVSPEAQFCTHCGRKHGPS